MRIAIVLNTSWNVWNFRRGLIQDLIKQGHEVAVIAPKDSFSDRLITLGCKFIPVRMDSRGINPIKDLALLFELLIAYKRYSPDLVLHYTVKPNIYGSIAAGILGIRNIPNVCGLGTLFLNPGFTTKLAIILYKFAFRFPYKVFFQNTDDQKIFVRKNIVNESKCLQIPGSGVDLDHFRPMPLPLKENNNLHFLMIARIIRDKGVWEFISAARLLKERGYNASFSIVGQLDPNHRRGISKAQFQKWLDWSGVKYLGFQEDLRTVILESDVVVLPSYREGTPKSLLEAAACSRPLIATDVPGCKQVVKPGFNGLLCLPRNSFDLGLAMEEFCLMKPEERKVMGINSRTQVETKFDERIIIAAYNSLIQDTHLSNINSVKKENRRSA